MREMKKQIPVLIACAVGLILIVILAAVIISSNSKNRNNTIILPQQQEAQKADSFLNPQQVFSSVTPENVQSVLSSMNRADYYHQVLSITVDTNEKSVEKQVDIWAKEDMFSAVIRTQNEKKHFLGNRKTVYVWYEDNETPQQIKLSDDVSVDSILGIADYSTILQLEKENISEASFVSLSELGGANCIFVLSNEHGMQQYYWISMDSGLLCKQTTLLSDIPLYSLQQTTFEPLSKSASSLDTQFLLPDGTNPFITE